MRRSTLATSLTVAVALVFASGASAAPYYAPWDGKKPFRCKTQSVGTGTNYSDPGADPFCVKYDKTHQNVTELGLVDFLLQEPARFAAASPKCRYFQRDEWTGRVVQEDRGTEIWHFEGRYYFDKSTGAGGVHMEKLRILGQPVNAGAFPFPRSFRRYFTESGGGFQAGLGIPADPRCT